MKAVGVFAFVALVGVASAAVAADEITALPGWTQALPSKQYSGYMSISSSKHSHYWFVECETDPANAPVVLWLNGGPGCSSLEGYLAEQGPLHVDENDHTKLYYNEYTWAKKANLIFLESPVGVGFSYSTDPRDYSMNDTSTANDNFAFLVEFFKAYPEYAKNDFYISGESYAGVYVPTLAARVLAGNANSESNIPLKGILVGNGCTGNDVGICGGKGTGYEKHFLAGHSLVSPTLSAKLDAACGDYLNPDATCEQLLEEMSAAIGNVDIYDIYTPCINGGLEKGSVKARAPGPRVTGPDGCIDGIAPAAWLNTKEVQAAIHVASGKSYWEEWGICSGKINYDSTASNLPKNVYPGLIAALETVVIYNGDVDACVPYLDNDAWTRGMGYDIKDAWHPWSLDKQVAGYAVNYVPTSSKGTVNTFTFVTVKGSGHMVPQYRPAPALELLTRFLNRTPF